MRSDKKKILIVSSSPQRDRLIDDILKTSLEDLGNEVYIEPMLPVITKKIVEIKPDVMVIPPIRNNYTYNFAESAIKWGVGVVIRHVEPGCDEKDIQYMSDIWKAALLHGRPEGIALELIWGKTEVDYIRKTTGLTNIVLPVGAFVADIYKEPSIVEQIQNKPLFCKRYNLDPGKKTILISSPWGLLDMESDMPGQTTPAMLSDKEAKTAWLEMASGLAERLKDSWNIMATLHPGLQFDTELMSQLARLGIPVDVKTTAAELLINTDVLIHAGSTMAIEMHWLGKPSFQFGDVNTLDLPGGNWWQHAGTAISHVSPFFISSDELTDAILQCDGKDNANMDAIRELEMGRYGSMDGGATSRAARLIDLIDGEYTVTWPVLQPKMAHPCYFKKFENIYKKMLCIQCDSNFWMIKQEYLDFIVSGDQTAKFNSPNLYTCPNCGMTFTDKLQKT